LPKSLCCRLKTTEWGQKTIAQLVTFIQTQEPGIKGFERRNLERMRQFYETYPDFPIASALLTQLSWTHHYILISRCKTFYHRELQSLVAFELKIDKFKPEYLGQLEFYLEALDDLWSVFRPSRYQKAPRES
jgi:predicted nuclease of restriction endonuclease-like (RecB) superfamily